MAAPLRRTPCRIHSVVVVPHKTQTDAHFGQPRTASCPLVALPVLAMVFRTATRDHDDRPKLDLGFLRKALPWMLGAWVVIGLAAWAVVAW